MKKIFTLAAALMASFSLAWADFEPTAVYTVGDAATLGAQWKTGLNNKANYFEVGDTVILSPFVLYQSAAAGWQEWTGCAGSGSTGTTWSAKGVFKGSSEWFTSSAKAATTRSTRQYFYNVTNCTAVQILVKSGSSSVIELAAYEIVAGVPSESAAKSETYNTGSDGVLEISGLDANKTYRIVVNSNKDSNSNYYEIAFVHPAVCEDPEFTVPENGTGFVGDPIDLAITSKNNSKPVNYAVIVDGVAGVYGTDYSFNVSPGLVQATPLKAGTFEITFSQASDGTYCDAEGTSTFVITEKTPVTSFDVEGPTEVRLGDEVTLTATNFNAAPTRVWWLDASTGEEIHEGATYTFTASNYGTFEYFVLARNDFNNPDEESYDYAFGMFGSVNVTVGTDATLSDLKVNGATIDDFAADKYEYNVELGVYEALNVVATPTDAPYATAVVEDNKEGKVTITVTAQNKSTKEYVINYIRAKATELASISNDAIWDFTKTGATEIKLTDATMPKKNEEFVFADLLASPDASFNAAALAGIQEYVVRDGKFCQGSQLRFVTTVPGTLEVVYSNTGNRTKEEERRFLVVNGVKIGEGSMKSGETVTEPNIDIAAGEVVLTGIMADESAQFLRFYKISFVKSPQSAIENADAAVKAVKVVRDGQLLIMKNGVLYNMQGAVVK